MRQRDAVKFIISAFQNHIFHVTRRCLAVRSDAVKHGEEMGTT